MPWEPEDIVGVAAVWVADDIALADGTAIQHWLDRIGGYDLSQGNAAQRPAYRTTGGPGGQPGGDFSASDLLRYGNPLSTALSGHVFVVLNPDSVGAATFRQVWASCDEVSTSRFLGGDIRSAANGIRTEQRDNDITQSANSDGTITAGTDYLLEWCSTGTAYEFRINGNLQTTSGTNNGDWFGDTSARDNFTIGGRQTTTVSLSYDGKIGTVVVVDGPISDEDRGRFYEWLNNKYIVGLPDLLGPTVTIEQAVGQEDPATETPILFTATFSDPVTDFTDDDVSFLGSTAGDALSAVVTGGPTTYTITATGMTTAGTVVVSIPDGVALDADLNSNFASTSSDNTVTWAPPVTYLSFVKRYGIGDVTLLAGSEIERGDTDGPALTSTFEEMSDLAAAWDGTQRGALSSGNRFYLLDNNKLRFLHECSLGQQWEVVIDYDSIDWRYNTGNTSGFESIAFSDDSWLVGDAPFGDSCRPEAVTSWSTGTDSEIQLRKWLGYIRGSAVRLFIKVDDNVRVWWNGVSIYSESTAVPRAYTSEIGPITVPQYLVNMSSIDNLLAIDAYDLGLGCNGIAVRVETYTI